MNHERADSGMPDFDAELQAYTSAEAALAELSLQHPLLLCQPEYLAVIHGVLRTLVETTYYASERERASVGAVAAAVAEAVPKFSVIAEGVGQDRGAAAGDGQRAAADKIRFDYSVTLPSPWQVNTSPMRHERGLGDKIILDGTEFEIVIGQVILSSDGSKRYVRQGYGDDLFYVVAGPDSKAAVHPDPVSLFPAFSEAQERELEEMAFATTEALLTAYGSDPDVLLEQTTGAWWERVAPELRERWRRMS
jgi:hypothetical protein